MLLQPLLEVVLKNPDKTFLRELRRRGLTASEVETLRVIALPWVKSYAPDARNSVSSANELALQHAAADLARHGLRGCSLPGCPEQEPHPRAFKVCARCHAAVYCCRER